jgi:PAS domain S-box-containing protein
MTDIPRSVVDEGEQFFRELADFAPVMIWRAGTDKLCDWFNKPWLDFVGRTMAQELGNGWAEGVHAEDFERCLKVYTTSFDAREKFSMTYRLRRHDGEFRYILDSGAPFYRSGEFAGYFGSCIDVTEQRAVETQLREAQKMDALGKLTGGVAHDFNNLLAIIKSSTNFLRRESLDDERRRYFVDAISDTVDRAAKLTGQLLAFARRHELAPEVFDISKRIRGIADVLRMTVGGRVKVATEFPDEICYAVADVSQFETALINIAVNARDAMDGDGSLTIVVNCLDGLPPIRGQAAVPGRFVVVSLADTGMGIAPDQVARIFEPFYTTKEVGKGTGLGLSQVYGFAKQSGGDIDVESELGRGARFSLFLPRADASLLI